MNISSVIVHARPDSAELLRAGLTAIAGVEVHAASAAGKLILTIETDNDRDMADRYEAIGRMDEVMSLAMVYHQTESDPEMEIFAETGANHMET